MRSPRVLSARARRSSSPAFGRVRRMTERAARKLDPVPDVLELDVDSDEDLASLRETLAERWGSVDGIVHAIAFAPPDALGGEFLDTPRASAMRAFETSAYSLGALCAQRSTPSLPSATARAQGRASSASTSTRRSPGLPTTGWASRRRGSSPSRAIWPAISARKVRASTSSRPAPSPRRRLEAFRASTSSPRTGARRRRSAGTNATRARSPTPCSSCSQTSRGR